MPFWFKTNFHPGHKSIEHSGPLVDSTQEEMPVGGNGDNDSEIQLLDPRAPRE